MGRKPNHIKTEDSAKLARALSMAGYSDNDIAKQVECAESTLKKHYAAELSDGRKVANAAVVSNLYRLATSRKPEESRAAVTASIFWCKTRLGWRETDHEALPTGPQVIEFRVTAQGERIKKNLDDEAEPSAAGNEPDSTSRSRYPVQ